MTEQDLNLRIRVHPQLMQRGQWLKCQKCFKVSKITEVITEVLQSLQDDRRLSATVDSTRMP